ncbi:MAG: hypothetical protein HY974_01935 [Candidatus Kerfeldbacteria bacterium]|nr:hypothetical protein [Candidatus Kerfeldbacteria bacterium]
MKKNLIISFALIALIVVSRLVPHVWNVAPVAAAALLAGVILPRKWALAVPLSGMLLGDFIIGFYHVPVMLTVYASFALMIYLGTWLREMQPHRLVLASLASSTFFFLTTNFAVWASADWYPKTWAGLQLCYTLALPFFRNTMLGDLIFTAVLFGVWALVYRHIINRRVFYGLISTLKNEHQI